MPRGASAAAAAVIARRTLTHKRSMAWHGVRGNSPLLETMLPSDTVEFSDGVPSPGGCRPKALRSPQQHCMPVVAGMHYRYGACLNVWGTFGGGWEHGTPARMLELVLERSSLLASLLNACRRSFGVFRALPLKMHGAFLGYFKLVTMPLPSHYGTGRVTHTMRCPRRRPVLTFGVRAPIQSERRQAH